MGFRFSGWYLLQSYFKEDDPESAFYFLIVSGSALAVFIIVRLIMRAAGVAGPGGGSRRISSAPVRRFSGFALRRAARSCGLNRDQSKMLEFVFKNDGVTDPEGVISNPVLMDKHFKRAYRTFERHIENDDTAQLQIARLFSTRNAIEFAQTSAFSGPPPRITAGMTAVLAAGGDSHPVKVLNVRGDHITVECPTNALGTPIKVSKGARIVLSFFTRTSKGFAVEGQVTGNPSTPAGPALELIRASRSKNLVQRRFKREQVGISCYIRPVKIAETGSGRKKRMRMIVDRRRFTGVIQDISIGGCAVKTNAGITAGSRIKIEFDYGGSPGFAVLGQILRLNRNGFNTVMHTKFLKVPRKAMNAINAAVFNYHED
ncbi:MAG: PilZ domain-containing protein [Treponema sp.]|nr:PilZ domain-containing protein [Treponema sp.]